MKKSNGVGRCQEGVAWSLIDGYDSDMPTLEIDPNGNLTSWAEAKDALVDALSVVVDDAECRREEAQDWKQEAMEELAIVKPKFQAEVERKLWWQMAFGLR
jgi:hypothetical protein